MSAYLKRYGVACFVDLPLLKAGTQLQAESGDWTPGAGDVKVSIDGGAAANIGTLPTAITMGGGAYWRFTIATGEVTGKTIIVVINDAAIEEDGFTIETYGHESSEHPHLGIPTSIYGTFATAGGLTVNACGTNVTTYTADQLLRRQLHVLSGDADGERVFITDFVVTNGVVTFAPPLTLAPANGDRFVIL